MAEAGSFSVSTSSNAARFLSKFSDAKAKMLNEPSPESIVNTSEIPIWQTKPASFSAIRAFYDWNAFCVKSIKVKYALM
jgi:hypothetical protein